MTTSLLVPLEAGFGHHGPPFFLGVPMLLLFLIAAGGFFLLARRGKVGPPPWLVARHSPEAEARRVLANRFAQGDISSEDFIDRTSVLNWTPGSDTWETSKKRKKR